MNTNLATDVTSNSNATNQAIPAPAQPPVADAAPTPSDLAAMAALVTRLSAALDAAEVQLGADTPSITAAQKKRTGKPRKGSDKVLTQLAPIVEQYGLNSSSLNTARMLALYNLAQTLVPLQARLQKVVKRVDDEVFNAQTGSWEMGLQFYSLLQRRAKTNGNLAIAIEPLVKVFSYRHPTAQRQSKVTTRIKAKLKTTLVVANKHGVTVSVAPDGGVQSIAGEPAAVAAAHAELAAQGVTVAPAATGAQAVTPVNET